MSSTQQSINAGQTQGKAEECTESARDTANAAKDRTENAAKDRTENADKDRTENAAKDRTANAGKDRTANAATDCTANISESTRQSVQQEKERSDFLYQTGEKVVNMAQSAVDTVKNTLGMGERNK